LMHFTLQVGIFSNRIIFCESRALILSSSSASLNAAKFCCTFVIISSNLAIG